MSALFAIGQIVHLRVNMARSGPVVAVLPAVDGLHRYQVFHTTGDTPIYYEEQLEMAQTLSTDPFRDAFDKQAFLSPQAFAARLTAERLRHPLTDTLYALHAARIEYIPFQLKPVLRILRSDRPRLLIADEVGVGKTIEAGLILKELQSRQTINRVLIVCPKALTTKWRAEMRRFDEDFVILSPEALHYCLRETDLDGEWPAQYSRAIVNLELLRGDSVLTGTSHPGLLQLHDALSFDLLILDEAHHVRTPSTSGHNALSLLCDVSEAVVFLSATPVQTTSDNLYQLLHLLRPDLFQDSETFATLVEPNQHLNKAIQALRNYAANPTAHDDAFNSLNQAGETKWGRLAYVARPEYTNWLVRLQNPSQLTDEERIRCLRDVEELHTLAHVVNRTRRRDIGAFTVREAHTISSEFTPLQRSFYELLIDTRYQALRTRFDPSVARMIIDTLERQAASCLPAIAESLQQMANNGRFDLTLVADDIESEDGAVDTAAVGGLFQNLAEQAMNLKNEPDLKFDELQKVLTTTLREDGPRKILIFSFFLHTLDYLYTRLKRLNYRVGLVNGSTPDDMRESIRGQFAQPFISHDAIDILLSSEVGCEGLDYQFCDRLVNYDIPWNPMRIEQRIGRIDRHGQLSPKVQIYNFVTPNTVEERIYFRCFERLGIFKSALGDLEAVMGDFLSELDEAALNRSLTPNQASERALQQADNILRKAEEQRRVEESGYQALTLDASVLDEVTRLASEGRFVSGTQLEQLLRYAITAVVPPGRLTSTDDPLIYHLRFPVPLREAVRSYIRERNLSVRSARSFFSWLENAEPNAAIKVTFDQSTAAQTRDIEFLTPIHPLIRWAIVSASGEGSPILAVLNSTTRGPAGKFIILIERWETVALRADIGVRAWGFNLSTGEVLPISISEMQDFAAPFAGTAKSEVEAEDWKNATDRLNEVIAAEREKALVTLRETNQRRINDSLHNLDIYFRNRLDRIKAAQMTGDEKVKRMKLAEEQRVESEYDRRRRDIEGRHQADILTERLAMFVWYTESEQIRP